MYKKALLNLLKHEINRHFQEIGLSVVPVDKSFKLEDEYSASITVLAYNMDEEVETWPHKWLNITVSTFTGNILYITDRDLSMEAFSMEDVKKTFFQVA